MHLYLNGEGELERPSDLIFNATIEDRDAIEVWFRRGLPESSSSRSGSCRTYPSASPILFRPRGRQPQGYFVSGGLITFVFERPPTA